MFTKLIYFFNYFFYSFNCSVLLEKQSFLMISTKFDLKNRFLNLVIILIEIIINILIFILEQVYKILCLKWELLKIVINFILKFINEIFNVIQTLFLKTFDIFQFMLLMLEKHGVKLGLTTVIIGGVISTVVWAASKVPVLDKIISFFKDGADDAKKMLLATQKVLLGVCRDSINILTKTTFTFTDLFFYSNHHIIQIIFKIKKLIWYSVDNCFKIIKRLIIFIYKVSLIVYQIALFDAGYEEDDINRPLIMSVQKMYVSDKETTLKKPPQSQTMNNIYFKKKIQSEKIKIKKRNKRNY